MISPARLLEEAEIKIRELIVELEKQGTPIKLHDCSVLDMGGDCVLRFTVQKDTPEKEK